MKDQMRVSAVGVSIGVDVRASTVVFVGPRAVRFTW
jgi:hypothetical protein